MSFPGKNVAYRKLRKRGSAPFGQAGVDGRCLARRNIHPLAKLKQRLDTLECVQQIYLLYHVLFLCTVWALVRHSLL